MYDTSSCALRIYYSFDQQYIVAMTSQLLTEIQVQLVTKNSRKSSVKPVNSNCNCNSKVCNNCNFNSNWKTI